MIGLPVPAGIGDLTGPAALAVIAVLVITRKLVWHKDLQKVEERAEKWEGIALTALGVADKLTVHAEVATEVLTRLPDPGAQPSSLSDGSAQNRGPGGGSSP